METDVAFQVVRRLCPVGVSRSKNPDDPDRLVISMVGMSEWQSLVS